MTSFDFEPLTLRQPGRYLLRMLGFLLVTSFIVWLVQEPLVRAIGANPLLNIGIIAVLVLGVLFWVVPFTNQPYLRAPPG
jgi:magnesium-transporting ATPase (P-type)